MKLEFRECDTCRCKPGTPLLCSGCLHNRQQMVAAAAEIERLRALIEGHVRMVHNDGEGRIDHGDYESLLAGIEGGMELYREQAAAGVAEIKRLRRLIQEHHAWHHVKRNYEVGLGGYCSACEAAEAAGGSMSDLVHQLRTHQYDGFTESNAIMDAAADEIERLRSEMKRIGPCINAINQSDAIHDTIWLRDGCTVVDELSMVAAAAAGGE